MTSWWKSYAVCATVAMAIATAAFVHYRNTSFHDHETERARSAAVAAARSQAAMPEVVVAFVQSYVERHHVEEKFHKRKRKPAESGDEAFARQPGWTPGGAGRGPSGDGGDG